MDFHTHTPESDDYANGEQDPVIRASLKQQTPDDWLRKHMAVELDAVVVTDHNSTGFISRLQQAYEAMVRTDPSFRPLLFFQVLSFRSMAGFISWRYLIRLEI